MNKKQLTIAWIVAVIFNLITNLVFAQDSTPHTGIQGQAKGGSQSNLNILDALTEVTTETEREQMKADLEAWEDPELIKSLSQSTLTEADINNLYRKFKNTIVNPPNPDTYTEYGIENAEDSFVKVEKLGRKVHNLFLALSDKEFSKYGKLIGTMRDVLYIDWKHIPYAIKHNNGRDIYWYELHNMGLTEAEKEYLRIFNSSN